MLKLDSYSIQEFYHSQFIDSKGARLGLLDDLVLVKDTFKIKKFLIVQYIKSSITIVIDWNDIDKVEIKQDDQGNIGIIQLNKSIKDFNEVKKSETLRNTEVFFSDMKKFLIKDKFGKILNQKIQNFIIGSNEYSIVTDEDYVITDTYVRSLQFSDKSIIIMLSEKQLATFKFRELETIRNQLHDLDPNMPDYSVIDNILEMGYSLEVLSYINSIESKNPTKTIRDNLLLFKAKIKTYLGEFDEAREILVNLELSVKDQLLGKVKLELGKFYLIIGNLAESKELLEETSKIFTTTHKDKIYESLSLNWLGLFYLNSGNITEAMIKFQKAREIARKNKNIRAEAFSMNNIGIILRTQGKIEEAIDILDEAINMAKTNSIRSMSLLLKNQAIAYFETGNQAKSLELHFDALTLRRKFGNILEISESLLDIALVENSLGKNISILNFFTQPMNKIKIIADYKNIVLGLLEKAEYKNYNEAITIWSSVLKSGLVGLEYQVQVYELIIEAMLLNIKEKKVTDEKYIQELSSKIRFGVKLAEKNSLIVQQCKSLLGLAKMDMFANLFEEALDCYSQALTIAEENNLFNFLKVINDDLKHYNENMKTFKELIDEELTREKEKWINSVLFYVKYLKSYNIF